jgi:hypothetical protein
MARRVYCQLGFQEDASSSSLNNRRIPAHSDCVRLVLGIYDETKHGKGECFTARRGNPKCSQAAPTSIFHNAQQNVFRVQAHRVGFAFIPKAPVSER